MSKLSRKVKKAVDEHKTDKAAERGDLIEGNPIVMQLTAPSSFDLVEDDFIKLGRSYRNYSYARTWEAGFEPGWATNAFINMSGLPITTIICEPSTPKKLKRAINSSTEFNNLILHKAPSASRQHDAQVTKDHNSSMLKVLSDSNEKFFTMMLFHAINADSIEDLEELIKERDSSASSSGITMASCTSKQEQAFRVASPYRGRNKIIESPARVPTIASTIAGSGIFSDMSLDDGYGARLGHSKSGDIVRLDTMTPTETRTNCNISFFGSSGSGKTTSTQKLRLYEFARGARQISIDADGEGIGIAKALHGQVPDLGRGMFRTRKGTVGACICPTEPRLGDYKPDQIWDETDVQGDDVFDFSNEKQQVLRATLTFLHGWAAQMWGTTLAETPYLDAGLMTAYKQFGIDLMTTADELKKNHYPVMDDLAETFEGLIKIEKDPDNCRMYKKYARLARQCGVDGIYGNLFGYYSTVDLRSDWINFDVRELTNAEAHVASAQLYSTLSWIWSQACASRETGQFLRVFIDELYMFLGGGSIKASAIVASYINMMQKRIRKYNGGLMIATQQLSDVLHEDIARYGESLLSNASYKFFFGTEGDDLTLLKDTFSFSEEIKTKIGGFGKGDCLAVAGKSWTEMSFKKTAFESQLYGKANGK